MFTVVALLIMTVPVAVAEDSGDIVIVDSRDVTTTLNQPATHVASFGAFATSTLVDIGCLDKAIIFDASSAYVKSGIVDMQNYSDDKFVTVSSGNKDLVVQTMLELEDDGYWNKTTDVIFGYGYSYLNIMWTELQDLGFHVVTFYPNSYDGIVEVVSDIETVVGADHSVSEQMTYVKTYIAETLLENGINDSSEKVPALYASFSSNVLRLGNGGSIAVDFINLAGGFNVANDTEKSVPTYSVDYTAIVQLAPDIVLLDGYYTGSADDFSDNLGNGGITVYKMNKTWNSYCPDATTGLWTVACWFYPEYFVGDIPVEEPEEEADNTMLYVGIGVGVVVIATAAIFLMRKH
ncbi:MAG: hypothetical protein WC375_00890 [Methanomassiliicoccales archaeon]